MLVLEISILAVLVIIFVQDIISRSVYWMLFPLLTALLVMLRLAMHQSFSNIWPSVLTNLSFLILQLLLVSAWFSFKKGRWLNITTNLLGLGDVLFLICTVVYLSVLNFLAFYMFSLIVILLFWKIWQKSTKRKVMQIPLAGLQSFLFALILAVDWWYANIYLTDDNWLLHFVAK
jgi:hypothetical protein